MNSELLTSFFTSIQAHPVLAMLAVFLVAFTESLALLGIIVPGAVLMLAIGALITLGHLSFWPTVSIAFLGAVAGDGLSYYLGHRYKHSLASWWPLSRYPQLLEKGRQFFDRHGMKSVLLGRFVGPLRPIIPAIAGMVNMPRQSFFIANTVSALFWAPLYLLPGMLFGLSLELASEFTGRFLIMALLLIVSIWLIYHLVTKLYDYLLPRADRIMLRILGWTERHPLAGEIPASIIDPGHPEIRGISLLATGMVLASVLFASVAHWILPVTHMAGIDKLFLHAFHTLHNPPIDHYMLLISFWGDRINSLLFIVMVATWLLWEKNRAGFIHWLGLISLPLLLSFVLPFHPFSDQSLINTGNYLHSVIYFSLWGFFSILLASHLAERLRLYVYIVITILLSQLVIAQLYFGITRFSEIMTGLLLGFIWSSLLGIAYRRHCHPAITSRLSLMPLVPVLTVSLLLYPAIQYYFQSSSLNRSTTSSYLMAQQAWQESGWQLLPLIREDLFTTGRHPFNLQWAASAEDISAQLLAKGFQKPASVSSRVHQWITPYAQTSKLAVLPHVHDGQYENLRFIRYDASNDSALLVRLWPSAYNIRFNGHDSALWVGSVSTLMRKDRLWFSYLVTDTNYSQALQRLYDELAPGKEKSLWVQFDTSDQGHHHLLMLWE